MGWSGPATSTTRTPEPLMATQRLFYGWWLVLACLLVQAIGAGCTMYLFSLFAGEVERDFEVSRSLVMMAATGHGFAMGLLAPKLGALLDRHSIRNIVIGSAFVMGAGFFLMSFTLNIWGFVGTYTLIIPIGSAVLTMLFSPMLLSRWFRRNRGLAIGIAALGTQFGGLVVPPLVALLIEASDWRVAMRVVGIAAAVTVFLLARWVIVDRPEDRGLAPDGDVLPEDDGDAGEAHDGKPADRGDSAMAVIMRNRNFWLAAFGMSTLVATFGVLLSNLALFATDIGTPRDQAALLISLFAIVGMVSSPIAGRLCDLLDIRWVFAGILFNSIIALALFSAADSYAKLAVATVIVAFSGGAISPFYGAMIAKLFDLRMYGRVLGSMSLFSFSAGAASPIISGWVFDMTSSYRLLFIGLIVLMLLPLACIPMIRLYRETPRGGGINPR